MKKGEVSIKWIFKVIVWLSAIARMRWHYNRFYFSKRHIFMDGLRREAGIGVKIAYPDAFMLISHGDINRVLKQMRKDDESKAREST